MQHTRLLTLVTAAALAAVATAASAQDKRVLISIGAGFTAPNSEVRDHLGDGYNFNIGLQVNVNRKIGIEGLYSFNGLGEKQINIGLAPTPIDPISDHDFFGDMNMQYGTANVVFQKPDGNVRPYGLAGGGIYYRPIHVTTPGVGYVPPYCDPFWYYCYPGGFVPVDVILAKRSSTDFGMDFGGGVNFKVAYAEVRYHYVWGPEVEISDGGSTTVNRKANGQFFVTTFGVRF
jgi:Outer membrane protein beta-barrel domain